MSVRAARALNCVKKEEVKIISIQTNLQLQNILLLKLHNACPMEQRCGLCARLTGSCKTGRR